MNSESKGVGDVNCRILPGKPAKTPNRTNSCRRLVIEQCIRLLAINTGENKVINSRSTFNHSYPRLIKAIQ